MIQFKTVKFKNFGSFGNNYTQIDLAKNATTLICGNNGSGKSFAFLDSITYGLFGKPFRKVNISQLVNSVNNKQCIVEITFQKGTDLYLIKRGINPKIFEIYKNNILLDQDSKSIDYQSILEDSILKMNYKTFTQVVILGSSSFVPFMQLTANDRRGVIENILDIDVFSTMNLILKGKIMQTKEIIKNISNKIEIEKNKIEIQTQYVNNIVNKSKDQSDLLNSEINELKKQLSVIESESSKINTKIIDITSKTKHKDELKLKIEKVKDLHTKLSLNIKTLTKDLQFFIENDKCPMCRQNIDNEFRTQQITTKQNKKKDLELATVDLLSKWTDVGDKLTEVNNQLDIVTTLQVLLGKKESSIENYKSQLVSLHSKKETKTEQDKDIDLEENKLEKYKNDLSILITQKEDLQSDLIYNESVFELLKDGGVKSKIIKYYLPYINAYINKFLTSMDFFAQFNLDENFNEEIKSRNRDTFSYENFSEGEKMRIDLSLLLAWREIARAKNSINCNLLILDEVFDSSLDSGGMEELMKIINAIGNKSNIFIISHKSDQLADKFQNMVLFEKKNNFSKMLTI